MALLVLSAAGSDRLNQIEAAAPDSFEAIWGEEIDNDYFRPTVWPSDGASGCSIDLTLPPLADVRGRGSRAATLAARACRSSRS